MHRPFDRFGAPGLAPTLDELADAYSVRRDRQPPYQRAEAVIADPDGITVLCTAAAGEGGEHTRLLWLDLDGALRHQRRYPPDHGIGRALAMSTTGQLLVAGEVRLRTPAYVAQLMRVEADGDVVVQRRADTGAVSGFVTVAPLANGSAVAGGTCDGHGSVALFDTELRESRQELPTTDEVVCVTALGDGYAAVAAEQRSTTSLGAAHIIATRHDGRCRWDLRLPGVGHGELVATAPLDGDRIVLAGHVEEGADTWLWAVVAGADGNVEWERRLYVSGVGWRARGVSVLGGSHLVVAGDTRHGANRRTHIAWLDRADGTPVLQRQLSPGDDLDEVVAGTAPVGEDEVIVVGTRSAPSSGDAVLFVRLLDAAGALRWERMFGASL